MLEFIQLWLCGTYLGLVSGGLGEGVVSCLRRLGPPSSAAALHLTAGSAGGKGEYTQTQALFFPLRKANAYSTVQATTGYYPHPAQLGKREPKSTQR